jgi:hypothetical protein
VEAGPAEWDRVTARIAAAWEKAGFAFYKDNVYLLDPASVVPASIVHGSRQLILRP